MAIEKADLYNSLLHLHRILHAAHLVCKLAVMVAQESGGIRVGNAVLRGYVGFWYLSDT